MDDSFNPEPPPEIVKISKDDLIGDTMFSKHWLFEVLLKLIKKVEDETFAEQAEIKEPSEGYRELEADFEKDLCDLWDMSVEKDVVSVLDQYNSIQIFEGFIRKFDSKYPRAIEILIGILVNMATLSADISSKISNNHSLINYLLFDVLDNMADVPTVIQVIRLFSVFVSDTSKTESNTFKEYLKIVCDTKSTEPDSKCVQIIEKLNFILEQSLNASLLDSTCSLILLLIDSDEVILNEFAHSDRFVEGLCNAAMTRFGLETSRKQPSASATFADETPAYDSRSNPEVPQLKTQISLEDISTIDVIFNKYFLCFQTLSTCEKGAMALFKCTDSLVKTFDEYLDKCLCTFNDWEIKSARSLKATVGEESFQNLVCVLSVLNCLVSDESTLNEIHLKFSTFYNKLFVLCKYYLNLFDQVKHQEDTSEFYEQFSIAHDHMKEFFKFATLLKKHSDQNINRVIDECVALLH